MPPCADGVQGGDETDVDCGGARCGPCQDGKRCLDKSDCASGRCAQGVCLAANPCRDGVKNGGETDIDCGGPTCDYCAVGKRCRVDGDCLAEFCRAGMCASPLGLSLDFAAPVLFPAGSNPRDLVAADWNGDTRPDVAVQNNGSSDVTVFLGRGDGTFVNGRAWPVGTQALAVLAADFNGDHRADIAVAGSNTRGVAVILGKGDGTFGAEVRTTFAGSPSIWGFAAGDLDGDGLDDIVTGNKDNSLPLLLSLGKGDFHLDQTGKWEGLPDQVQIADFDRDGFLDVIGDDGTGLLTARGDGTGKLQPVVHVKGLSGCPYGIAHDLDRDGALDVFTCDGDLHRGKGDGTFAVATNIPVAPSPRGVAVADFDRDGLPDVAVGDAQSVYIARGKRGGTFAPPVSFPCTDGAFRLAVADFDGDGKPDLAALRYGVGWALLRNVSK